MAAKKTTFEDSLAALEKSVSDLKRDDITLDEALKSFESGMKQYESCRKILDEAKQKIEVYKE